MILHENPLPADDPHEISYLILVENWERCRKIWNCRLLQIFSGALRIKLVSHLLHFTLFLLAGNFVLSFANSLDSYQDRQNVDPDCLTLWKIFWRRKLFLVYDLNILTGPETLKNHKPTKPAFNVGPSSARQRNAISPPFKWRFVGGPMIARL